MPKYDWFLRKPPDTNEKVLLSVAHLKRATKDELQKALQEALKDAGHTVTLSQLYTVKVQNGLAYRHPATNETLITSQYDHKAEQTVITVYNPEGHIASRIKQETVRPYKTREGVPCITEIKDYNPPTKKQKRSAALGAHSQNDLHDEWAENDRTRTIDRHTARDAKTELGAGPDASYDTAHPDENEVHAGTSNGQAASQTPARLQGTLRRERTFKLPNFSFLHEAIPTAKLTLDARMAKDVIRRKDGSYTAIQYNNKDGCNSTNYDVSGKRLSQTTFDSYGKAIKEAGEQTVAPTLPKVRRPQPSDTLAALRTRIRDWRREDRALRDEHIATDAAALAPVAETSEKPAEETLIDVPQKEPRWRRKLRGQNGARLLKGGTDETQVEKLAVREQGSEQEPVGAGKN